HKQSEQGQDFLCPAEREGWNEHATFAFEDAVERGGEPLDFVLTRKAGWHFPVAARGLHNEHVGLYLIEARPAQEGLVAETDIAGIEEGFFLAAHHDARGAERVA